MSKSDDSHIIATMREHAEAGHGDIYRWLKKNRRKIQAGFESTGSGWDGVVALLVEAGVGGRNGQAPNPRSVRRVWARLCADFEVAATARAAAKVKKPAVHRSQQNPNWQPLIAAEPRTARATQPHNAPHEQLPPQRPSSTPTGQGPPMRKQASEFDDDSTEAKLRAIRRQFAYVDRHIIRQPEED